MDLKAGLTTCEQAGIKPCLNNTLGEQRRQLAKDQLSTACLMQCKLAESLLDVSVDASVDLIREELVQVRSDGHFRQRRFRYRRKGQHSWPAAREIH